MLHCAGAFEPRGRPLRPRRLSGDRGSAVIEFLVIGVLVLVPLAYGIVALARVQAASMASTQAVREAARAFITSSEAGQGQVRARSAAELALEDQGFELPPNALRISCSAPECLAPGGLVDLRLDWQVPLPFVPEQLPSSVPIQARHTALVDEYRAAG